MSDDRSDFAEIETAGQGDWTVEPGDSIDSIAEQTGHFWQTLWDHPDNAALKSVRPSRTVLMPGDRVTVPDLRPKAETRQTDLIHSFKRKGVPAVIRFQVLDVDGAPQPDRPYTLEVGRRRYEGTTDGDGKLEHYVSPGARQAVLTVRTDPADESVTRRWTLQIGRLQPVGTIEGLQSRLNNLGYGCGPADGELGPKTEAALNRFLTDEDLPAENGYDSAAQDALRARHGS